MRRVGLQGIVRTRIKGGAIINAREGDGEGNSPQTDKESEEEDRNHGWMRSNARMLLTPLFFELDGLINQVSLRTKRI